MKGVLLSERVCSHSQGRRGRLSSNLTTDQDDICNHGKKKNIQTEQSTTKMRFKRVSIVHNWDQFRMDPNQADRKVWNRAESGPVF